MSDGARHHRTKPAYWLGEPPRKALPHDHESVLSRRPFEVQGSQLEAQRAKLNLLLMRNAAKPIAKFFLLAAVSVQLIYLLKELIFRIF